jgi:hypothetical protein
VTGLALFVAGFYVGFLVYSLLATAKAADEARD